MAFDFGIKHIGIAIGQEITKTASTFYSIKALEGQPDWNELDDIIHEWKPDLIVVGDPYNMDGSRSKIQDMSDRFSDALYKRYQIQLEKTDERLSSREANERLQNLDIGTKSSSNKHSISAQVILEDWFRSKE
ncbi:MAG: Holliday junction resolvase RuvX [Gammaproteobacteria bacterium]|jgi:putative Holliday junction resolvase|nr:Holliday junction resolvase RuvX [Gammaproteobacteria bacterium]|tara:strand:+ start:262 stop:660 length:399 start_codon:yes stop_codon:yes gene_type:complete